MPKNQLLKWVVTANFTEDSAVAYMRADQGFSRQVADAVVLATKEEADRLLKVAQGMERIVSDPYLIEVAELPSGGLDLLSVRERIRSQGPTVPLRRPDPRVSVS